MQMHGDSEGIMREYKNTHFKTSDLIELLFTGDEIKEIGNKLSIPEAQAKRAAVTVYQRAKVSRRVEFMAQEIARLRQRKDRAA
jgi:hypothetical protein